jgi:Tat protein translocase TatB subunit
MGSLGWSEIMVIMVLALVVFGPNRLPDIARQVGKAIREVRRVSSEFQDEVKAGLGLDDDDNFPYAKPKALSSPAQDQAAPETNGSHEHPAPPVATE